MDQKEFHVELMRKWVVSVIDGIDAFVEEDAKKKILETCGKACGVYHGHLDKIANLKRKGKNLKEILDYMNRKNMWCGDWIYEDDIISSTCKTCECPLILNKMIELSPTFCYCSRGFVKAVFEKILEKPVDVELNKAIGRGDEVCHFTVAYGKD